MTDRLRWGILATGNIAHKFARAVRHSQRGTLAAVASRSAGKARAFANRYNIPNAYGDYVELMADEMVQAVYVATPHPMHLEWTLAAAHAGKHILCEKPIGMNLAETEAMISAARDNDVFLMEAFSYRCHPQTAKLIELVRSGAIGCVRVIKCTFSFRETFPPEHRAVNKALGGGGILDLGCYCASMARLLAGVATGGQLAEPIEVVGSGVIGSTGADDLAIASLKFPNGVLAQLSVGMTVRQENTVELFGTAGRIVVPVPWGPAREGGKSSILLMDDEGKKTKKIVVRTKGWLLGTEVDAVAEYVAQGRCEAPWPAMGWGDMLGNMKTLDQWRAAIGLRYDADDA